MRPMNVDNDEAAAAAATALEQLSWQTVSSASSERLSLVSISLAVRRAIAFQLSPASDAIVPFRSTEQHPTSTMIARVLVEVGDFDWRPGECLSGTVKYPPADVKTSATHNSRDSDRPTLWAVETILKTDALRRAITWKTKSFPPSLHNPRLICFSSCCCCWRCIQPLFTRSVERVFGEVWRRASAIVALRALFTAPPPPLETLFRNSAAGTATAPVRPEFHAAHRY